MEHSNPGTTNTNPARMGTAYTYTATQDIQRRFWVQKGRCKATWKRKFKLPLLEAGPPNHLGDKVDSDHWVFNTELSLFGVRGLEFTGNRVGDGKHEHVHLVQSHVLL